MGLLPVTSQQEIVVLFPGNTTPIYLYVPALEMMVFSDAPL